MLKIAVSVGVAGGVKNETMVLKPGGTDQGLAFPV